MRSVNMKLLKQKFGAKSPVDPIKELREKHPDLKEAYERYLVLLNLYKVKE